MNIQNIRKLIRKGQIRTDEPMALHTTFRTGGPAAVFITPADTEETAKLLHYLSLNGLPYFVLGGGSNLLVSDRGYEGTVIDLGRNDGTEFTLLGIEEENGNGNGNGNGDILFDAGAGCRLTAIGRIAAEQGAAGFEALSGIPGCIGGACIMNAGAYGSEMKDVLESVETLTPEGKTKIYEKEALRLSYRHSNLFEEGAIVTRAHLRLKKGNPDEIRALTEEYRNRRKEKQPLEFASAGSTFKRPEGHFAGQLIEEAGLKGLTLGDAQVSEKHAGFIINRGNATSGEICGLIRLVQDRVFERSGVRLEPEVHFLGVFED